MKTRHGCGTHPAEGITRKKKRKDASFSLFPDADQASPLNFHSVVPSRDVTALFFLVIGNRNRRNSDEFNFPHCQRIFIASNKHRDRFRMPNL